MSDVYFDSRALAHSGLSTAMMAAFSFHTEGVRFGPGQKIGVVIAVVIGFMDAFFPSGAQPIEDPAATPQDVENALKGLESEVIDALWHERAQQIVSDISALTTGFYNIWDDLTTLQVDPSTCSFTWAASKTNKQREDFIAAKFEYFSTQNPVKTLTLMRQFRNTLQISSMNDDSQNSVAVAERQTRTIGLYGLVGSLTAAYLKAAIAWMWGRELLLAWQYDHFQKELADWKAKGKPYPISQLMDKYKEVTSIPGYQPLEWNDFVVTPGSAIPVLIAEVQDMLNYCVGVPATDTQPAKVGLYTSMMGDWTDFDTQIASYDVVMTSKTVTKADMFKAVEQGATRSGQWESLATQNARLANVTEDDLDLFAKTIDAWRAIAASVRFKVYLTQSGDYMGDLATTFFGSDTYEEYLFLSNSDILDRAAVYPPYVPPPPPPGGHHGGFVPNDPPRGGRLDPGTRLRIFELDALQYNLNPLNLTKGT